MVASGVASDIQSFRGGGEPLPESARQFFEPRFGRDFSAVRVHADDRAAEAVRTVSGRAFTLGSDIVFGRGEYSPGSAEGRRLLAHELTHVVQQTPAMYRIRGRVVDDAGTRLQRQAGPAASKVQGRRIEGAIVAQEPLEYVGDGTLIRVIALGEALWSLYRSVYSEKDPVNPQGQAPTVLRWVTRKNTLTDPNVIPADARIRVPSKQTVRRLLGIETKTIGHTACFDGATVFVNKNGKSHACSAITGTAGAPTPNGWYCIRKQGAAQLSDISIGPIDIRKRSDWYLLEPQFTTERFKMQLHPGGVSEGCVTVTDDKCFEQLATILNGPGVMSGIGYDGYPPGNKAGDSGSEVKNPKKRVACVGWLRVNREKGGCK